MNKRITKRMKQLIMICCLGLMSQIINAATYTVGTGGSYTSLYAAFDDINNGNITGDITLQITSSLIESTTCQLDFSGFGGNYNSILIYPTAPNLSITGSFWPGHLIQFNGADNVTIDGRVNATGNTPSLKIAYTGSSSAGNSVIYLGNNSQYNTIQYCNITTNAYDIELITFEGAQNAIGNSNNKIAHNNIYGMVDTYSLTEIGVKSGTANNASSNNHADSIVNNHIYNLRNYAVQLNTGTSGWYIAGNSIYDTYGDNSAITRLFKAIYVQDDNSSANKGITIEGNYIGGSAPLCGGSALMFQNNGKQFYGIEVTQHYSGLTKIHNNTIKNISITDVTGGDIFTGIYCFSRKSILNNIIGSTTSNNSINVTATMTNLLVKAIYLDGSDSSYCNNNQIGGIQASNVGGYTDITAIQNYGTTVYTEFLNNIIGSATVANNIEITNSSTGNGWIRGLYMSLSATTKIENNLFANFTNNAQNTATNYVYGIHVTPAQNASIKNNIIHHLTSTMNVIGINSAGAPGSGRVIENNKVYNLHTTSIGANWCYVTGIQNRYEFFVGQTKVNKNFVYNLTGSSATTLLSGMVFENASNNSEIINNIVTITANNGYVYAMNLMNNQGVILLHNTIYVNASTPRNSVTTCLYLDNNLPTKITNNIFFNGMANASGVTKNHFCVYNQSNSNFSPANYNVYRVANTSGGGAVAFWNATSTSYNNLAQWKFITNRDTNSVNIDPLFVNAGGSNAGDYYPTANVIGATYLGISTDYFSNIRVPDFWMGALQSTGASAPLPLTWKSFTAELTDNNTTDLTWSTSSEANTLSFEVEKSTDAINWKNIHQQSASGESDIEKTYNAIDAEVAFGTTFYRIKQLDIDGKFTYSPVRKVYRETSLEAIIYPNPVMDNLHISTNTSLPTSIKIYTLDGKQLVDVNSNEATLSLNVASLPKGTYLIRISNTEKTYTSKFVRQ